MTDKPKMSWTFTPDGPNEDPTAADYLPPMRDETIDLVMTMPVIQRGDWVRMVNLKAFQEWIEPHLPHQRPSTLRDTLQAFRVVKVYADDVMLLLPEGYSPMIPAAYVEKVEA